MSKKRPPLPDKALVNGIGRQPVSTVTWVDRNSLEPNDFNPNVVPPLELDLLTRSIAETGWTQPIVVMPDGKTIVDGFHRYTVAARPVVHAMTNGMVPVVVCGDHMTREHHVAATVRHNRARGEHGIREMIKIVHAMLKEMTAEEVGAQLGMVPEEVERLHLLTASTDAHADPAGGFSPAWTPEEKP